MLAERLVGVLLAGLSVGCHASSPAGLGPAARLTHGVAVGELTDHSAVVWLRCVESDQVELRVHQSDRLVSRTTASVSADDDWTARVSLLGLTAATRYRIEVDCGDGGTASFATASSERDTVAVRIAFGGDLGGQNVCRNAETGYSVFDRVAARKPDLFIGLGDMVYADESCGEIGRYGNPQIPGPSPANTVEQFRAHWRYNRSDSHLQALLASVPYVALWDDHEIRNDAGPSDDRRGEDPTRLMPPAMRAFLDYHPFTAAATEESVLYRSFRWGRHVELFVLDNRQYRDRNDAPDTDGGKTMLGATQLAWLKRSLAASDATWRIIVSSVPLSIPTGRGDHARDGWANGSGDTGFEGEAIDILRFAQRQKMRNLVWITTDVHFSTGFRYVPFADDPEFAVHEYISGPIHAGVFGRRRVDPTLRPERLYFHGLDDYDAIKTYDQALDWFNFGLIEVDEAGNLKLSIINARGRTVATHRLRSE